jgi:hypothetical protein
MDLLLVTRATGSGSVKTNLLYTIESLVLPPALGLRFLRLVKVYPGSVPVVRLGDSRTSLWWRRYRLWV